MKRIIISESQLKKIIQEITLGQQYDTNYNVIVKYIKNGYLVHGSTKIYDKFDQSKIKGGTRGEFGYGMYFTDTPYKALEYGNEIYLTKQNLYNFLDLAQTPFNPFEYIDNIKAQIINYEDKLNYVRSNREYDYYTNLIDELNMKINNYNSYESKIIEKFSEAIAISSNRTMEHIFKYVRNNVPSSYDKYISSSLLKLGYDGVKCENQYVIFNFDLLNNNLINYDIEE